uniref:Uncharacterized protein n=1 Tax=Arundo donax TaxID=35708 RepID=A0A0A9C7U6_ARUDO
MKFVYASTCFHHCWYWVNILYYYKRKIVCYVSLFNKLTWKHIQVQTDTTICA